MNPLIATALYGFAGLDAAIIVDLCSFVVAFVALAGFIRIPEVKKEAGEGVLKLAKEGVGFLKKTPLVLTMILFMSGVNLVASAFDAVLPGLVIPNPKGGTTVLGIVTSASGIAMVIGSIIVSNLPKPKDRVRVVYLTMLFSLGTDNFLLAFSREPVVWCIGQIIGWFVVPIMSANMNVVLRNTIPVELQGRVYACRNTLQFFTIPIGLFLGGLLVDNIFEPFMEKNAEVPALTFLFGSGKGSGAAVMMFVLGVTGVLLCLITGSFLKKYKYTDN
jgi:predicted MFS family arabinose efflux permease